MMRGDEIIRLERHRHHGLKVASFRVTATDGAVLVSGSSVPMDDALALLRTRGARGRVQLFDDLDGDLIAEAEI